MEDKIPTSHPLGITNEAQSIKNAIRTILLTSPGEVPFRPGFGFGAEKLLGGTISNLDIAYDVSLQLSTYEPRIKVKRVIVTPITTGSIGLKIEYQVLSNNATQTINI